MRTVAFFLYFFGYLFYTIPFVSKARKYTDSTKTVEQQNVIKQAKPKQWARNLMRISGSEVTVHGLENLPEGKALIVSNHEGNFDIPVLMSAIPKPFGFISKMEVKKIPVVARWMEVMNCVFMDRKDRRQSIKAIREGISIIKEGNSIVVFPEGTRSKGGEIAEFKSGSFRLATDAHAPIVPIALSGTSTIMEKNKGWIKPGKVVICILPPVSHDQYKDLESKEIAVLIRGMIEEEHRRISR